jgi:hypothetical protein
MPEIITSAEQVTPEWLTRTLRAKGYLDQSSGFSVLEVNLTRHTVTWFADISFLKVGYSGKAPSSAPSGLFLKTSKDNLESADLLYGRKEVEFYNTIASAMDDPPLASCYDAVYSPDTGRSHVLLQDLSETHSQPQPPLPPSRSECELIMDCLARFHAHWWEHPRLAADIGKLSHQQTSSAENLGFARPLAETAEMFPDFADFLGDRLSAARRKLYEQVLSSWPFPRLSQRVDETRHITLIHRDAHAWNFLYPRDPARDRVCMIDWHEWGIGLGTNDLTEMIVLWWYPERRARMEESLVRRYHRQLTERGVEGYDWEQCWNDYRLSASRILLYPIWMHGEGRPPTFWWPVLERGILAFQDLACVELLD